MCTLTYVPIDDQGYILGSNRDESVNRAPAAKPGVQTRAGQQLLYPMDPKAKGSWIASSKKGRTCCLLNGAFRPHMPKPPYCKSRGLVLLDSFQYKDLDEFAGDYDLLGIEPFTIVSFGIESLAVAELRWDGEEKHLRSFEATEPRIWCSALLYTEEKRQARESWFENWLNEGRQPSIDATRDFHHKAGGGQILAEIKSPHGVLIKTVSVTSIEVQKGITKMNYEDLLNSLSSSHELEHDHSVNNQPTDI